MLALRLARSSVLPAVALALAACEGQQPFVPHPTTVRLSSTSLTFGSVGATQTLVAAVLDQRGDTMLAQTVAWSSNNTAVATVSPTPSAFTVVSAAGNGSTQVVATAGTAAAQATVSVSQAAGQLVKFSGDLQTGTVGQQLPSPLVVQVNDANAHPVRDVVVTFQVTDGGGAVSAPGPTGSNGRTQVNWTIGTTARTAQTVRVTAGAAPVATFSATAVAGSPVSMSRQAGDSQTTATGGSVPIAPAVRVRDQYNNPPNVVVTFSVTLGGGSVTKPTDTTDVNGIASVGGWTLGSAAGENDLTATVSGTALSLTFVATAVTPGAAASVVVSAGDNQTGLQGYPLNVGPAVLVRDASSIPVSNVQVDFVPSAGGSVTVTPAMTDANGIAAVGWTVPLGPNTLTATVTGSGITGNPVTFNATGASQQYNVDVQYLTAVTPQQGEGFDNAKARWQRLIYGDEPDEFVNIPADTLRKYCAPGAPMLNQNIDDVIIYVRLDSIDGPGKILGQAGPCVIRDAPGWLPLVGVMQFDTADVASLLADGQWDDVALHEMGHVLGYGTIWSFLDVLVGSGGTDPHFVGTQAIAAFDRSGGQSYSAGAKVPVENCVGIPGCGGGTRDGHWRESVFDDELMTGYIDQGVPNPLSVISVASMGDLAYTVNYAGSEPYTVTSPLALRARPLGPAIELKDDILRLPILVVDARGRVVRVIRPR
jgi:hypothetical protein